MQRASGKDGEQMARLRIGRSYWLDTGPRRAQRFPTLRGDRDADVAIVGGGITGCAAALLFAQAGATVVLVDAHRLGRGSTAASTALLMQEPDTDFRDLARRYGASTARRIWECSRAAVRDFTQVLREAGAPSVQSLPSLYFAADDRAVDGLRAEARARHRARLPGRWIDGGELLARAGFEAPGAILTEGNAEVDPYRACHALARAAARNGAALHEGSAVRRVDHDGSSVRMRLDNGATIRAAWAVVATGYATPAFEHLVARFRMMNTYVVATRRFTPAERRRIGLGRVMLWDTRRPYHYARWTPDGRLLFGGRDRPQVPGRRRPSALRARTAELLEDLAALYPMLGGERAAYAWEGLFATTPDGLPYIGRHRLYPRQLFALGYGGNGMTLAFLGAQAVVRIAQGRETADDELFGFGRLRRTRRD
jgi:glycine/D-amino acid oxidase-like deaminating enzyme